MEKSEVTAGHLIPEESVAGYTVKPWTLAQVIALTEEIEAVAQDLGEKGATLDGFAEKPMETVKMVAPHLPKFLAVTLGIPVEEAGEMPAGDAVLVALTIVRQNINHIRNLFGPASEMLATLAGMMGAVTTTTGGLSGQSSS